MLMNEPFQFTTTPITTFSLPVGSVINYKLPALKTFAGVLPNYTLVNVYGPQEASPGIALNGTSIVMKDAHWRSNFNGSVLISN